MSTVKGYCAVDDEVLDQICKPNVPRNKGFNNLYNRACYMNFRYPFYVPPFGICGLEYVVQYVKGEQKNSFFVHSRL